MPDDTYDVVKCESCSALILTYYTTDKLTMYVFPNCVDWSASETQNKPQLFLVN